MAYCLFGLSQPAQYQEKPAEAMMYVVVRYSIKNKNMHWNDGNFDQFTTPIETLEVGWGFNSL